MSIIYDAELTAIKLAEAVVARALAVFRIKPRASLVGLVTRIILGAIVFGSVLIRDLITGAYQSSSGDKFLRLVERHSVVTAVVITVSVFLIGAMAAAWKQLHQGSYGLVELLFGAAFAFNVALGLARSPSPGTLFVVGTSAYLIARGFSNVLEANKKAASNALAQSASG